MTIAITCTLYSNFTWFRGKREIKTKTLMCKTHYIEIKGNTGVPKYQQLMKSILNGIKKDRLKIGDRIPSINYISEEYGLSRSTVEKAYVELRNLRIIKSVKGKGFYIAKTDLRARKEVLFLVSQFDSYIIQLLNTFTATLDKEVKIDLEMYNGDPATFKDILERKKSQYEHLVVLLQFKDNKVDHNDYPKEVLQTLETVSPDKLILLDKKVKLFSGKLRQVYQDFENNFYKVLIDELPNFKKYERIILTLSDDNSSFYPMNVKVGLKRFCAKYDLDYEITDKVCEHTPLNKKTLYLLFEESDLIELIRKVKEEQYTLGEDIDIVSYRDSTLKKYLGISVIETDYQKVVKAISEMLLQESIQSINIDFKFIKRIHSSTKII